jgi:hypothetical protein
MVGFRASKNQARRDLHAHAEVPAYYRASVSDEWIPVEVRLHTNFNTGGDLTGFNAVQVHDISPRLIFMRDQVNKPARGAIVSIEEGEAWQLGDALEPDGITIAVMAAPVPVAQTTGFPVRDNV